jgi:hypothetical protein
MAELTVKDLQKKMNKAQNVRQKLEADWFLNLAYFAGDQWIFWNNGRIDRPRLPDWRVTLTDNRILPVAIARVARKLKNRPVFTATPFSADEEDLNAAELAEKILEYDWSALDCHDKLHSTQLWTELTGSAFWKVYWDSSKGDKADYVMTEDGPYRDQNEKLVTRDRIQELGLNDLVTNGQLKTQSIARGEVAVEVLSPFEIYPDPLANDIHEAEWIIESKVRSLDYVKGKYGFDATEDAEAPVGIAESRMYTTGSGSETYKGVKVNEYYARPSKLHPEGHWAVWINDKLIKSEPLSRSPYVGCPYVMFRSQPIPGRFWPTSITTQLRGPQTDLNKIKSQIRENAIRLGNASVMISRQANVDYTGIPGEEIFFDDTLPNSVPQFLRPPDLPVYVLQEVDRIEASIQEISGLHEVSKASVPSGVTAASAINLLQEADDTRLGPEIADMEKALSYAGNLILKLRAKFNDDSRMIQIAGEDGDWDIFEFRGAMLKNNTNVEVQAGSAMPRSKAAKQAAMTEIFNMAIQYGMNIDPRQIRKFLRDYEVGGLDKLFANITQDEQQLVRENRILLRGEAIDINPWDDDNFHIEAHEEVQKSSRFFKAAPEAQAIFQAHVDAHRERRAQIVEAQAMAPPPGMELPPGMPPMPPQQGNPNAPQ